MAGEANEKNGGNKKLLIIAVVVIVILLCAVGAMAALLVSKDKKAEAPKEMRKVVSEDTAEELVEQIIQEEEDDSIPKNYTVTQNGVWTFANGTAASTDAYVENDKENATPVYFDLIVDESEEVIYSSPILELGATLEGFTLDKPLEKGEYECTVEYHLVDEEQNTLTTTNVGVKVIILE